LTAQFLCVKKQSARPGRAFHWRAINATAYFNACSSQYWSQCMQFAVENSGISGARQTHIDQRARVLGDNVGCRSTSDDVRLHGDTAPRVVQLEKSSYLQCQFVNRVDASFRVDSCVRGAAGNNQFDFADPFALGFQPPFAAESRLENENGIALARGRFNCATGNRTANFFIGRPKENNFFPHRDA
jgi:hypothetical protein